MRFPGDPNPRVYVGGWGPLILTLRARGEFRGAIDGREVAHRPDSPYIEGTSTIYGIWHIHLTMYPLRYVDG